MGLLSGKSRKNRVGADVKRTTEVGLRARKVETCPASHRSLPLGKSKGSPSLSPSPAYVSRKVPHADMIGQRVPSIGNYVIA